MKNIFFSAVFALSAVTAVAQNPYNLTVLYQPYAHLTTMPVNDTAVWTTGNYSTTLPFAFKLAGQSMSRFNLMTANIGPATDTTGTINGMLMMGAALIDRGFITGRSRSPIRFQVTGSTPNRIFKAEVQGAGFAEEMMGTGTTNDSVNLQMWLYETSNVVELRYGPSKVSANPDYFSDGGPSVGFVRGLNMNTPAFQKFYGLVGSPASPTMDSFNAGDPERGLSAYPAAGTVYRFTPKVPTSTGIEHYSEIALVRPYPNPFTDQLAFRYGGREKVDYQIIAMNGAKLKEGQVGYGEHQVDVRDLVPGAYIVRISSGTEARSAQFIKR